jgi:nucleoside-diphosphate-sugar epimerase
MKVLVTGASGFVGAAVLRRLEAEPGCDVRAASRRPRVGPASGPEWVTAPDLSPEADWRPCLAGVDVVVHLAAHVHVMSPGPESATEYQRVNVLGTRRLAQEAVAAGVRRLVFLSSVKVHGESGKFDETSPMTPADPYGVSKRDAEAVLRQLAAETGLEVVIIRPPLVYGPGVKANFRSLLDAVRKGTVLPLASIANRRSLVGVDNLADVIAVCLGHPAAASEAFLVSDGEDVSTPDLIRKVAAATGGHARLLPVPVWCLRVAGRISGRAAAIDRLTGTLEVDISKAHRVLGWAPRVSLDEGLRRMAARS